MIDAQCNNTANDLQKIEMKISQTCLGSIDQHLMRNRRSLSASMSILEGMREVPSKLNMSLEANRSKIRALNKELQQVISYTSIICRVSIFRLSLSIVVGFCFGIVI